MRVPLTAAAAPAGIATAAAAAAAVAAMCIRKELKPSVQGQSTPWNSAILGLCPSLTAPYRLPPLLNNGHVVSRWVGWIGIAHVLTHTDVCAFT